MKELFKTAYKGFPCPIDPHYTHLESVDVEENGMITKRSQFKETCFGDKFKQFKMEDFAISNILSVGATNLLKPVSMTNNDVTGVAQGFDDLNAKLNENGATE